MNETQPGTSYNPYNQVTASAKDNATGEEVKSSASAGTTVSKEMVRKSGSYDAETGLITWVIVVNPDGDNIAGYTLTDDMMRQALSLTVSPTNGHSIDYTTGTITFGETNAGGNTNTYTITYTTAHDQTTASTPVSNTVVLKDNNNNKVPTNSGTAGVTVPGAGGINKTGTMNSTTGIITWTVTVTIPEGGIGAGTVITDHTGQSWGVSKNHWLTQQQIYLLAQTIEGMFPGVNYTLEFGTDGWNWTEYSAALNDTNTTEYYCWRLTFNETVISVANGNIQITYNTTADLDAVTSTETYVNYVSMGSYNSTASVEYKPPVAKLDRYYRSGVTSITSTDGIIAWFVRITPDGTEKTIQLTDMLPEGVTLSKLGIGHDGNAAVNGATAVSSNGVVSSWDDLSADYEVKGRTVTMNLTNSGGTFSAGQDVYVYLECRITDLPQPGETKT